MRIAQTEGAPYGHSRSHSFDLAGARYRIDLLRQAQADTTLHKAGANEWDGPCPFCGGHDRFSVQPNSERGPRWFCRKCGDGHWHDVLDYIARRENISVAEAAKSRDMTLSSRPRAKPAEPEAPAIDDASWMESACDFVIESQARLHATDGEKALAWLRDRRGLHDDTIEEWQLGFNPEERYRAWGGDIFLPRGVVIPCWLDRLRYIKVRQGDHADPKYRVVRGGHLWLFGADTLVDCFDMFLFESELDMILAWQEWPGEGRYGQKGIGFCSLPAGQPWHKEYAPYLKGIERIILAGDNDEAGQFSNERLALPGRTKCAIWPEGIKDLGELQQGGHSVLDWLSENLEGGADG